MTFLSIGDTVRCDETGRSGRLIETRHGLNAGMLGTGVVDLGDGSTLETDLFRLTLVDTPETIGQAIAAELARHAAAMQDIERRRLTMQQSCQHKWVSGAMDSLAFRSRYCPECGLEEVS